MNATALVIRAVTAVYAQQLLRPILLIGLGIYAAIVALTIWLGASISWWWLLILVLPTFVLIVGLVIWILAWKLSQRLAPSMNKKQRTATKKFVSMVGRAAEHIGTPKFILIGTIIKDVIFPPQNDRTLIAEIAQTPGEMRREFEKLRKLF